MKPITCEELEQRVKELEQEAIELRKEKEALQEREKQAEEEIRQLKDSAESISQIEVLEEQYKALFDGVDNGVAIYQAIDEGRDFIIKAFNQAAARIEQVERDTIIGMRVLEAFPGVKE